MEKDNVIIFENDKGEKEDCKKYKHLSFLLVKRFKQD